MTRKERPIVKRENFAFTEAMILERLQQFRDECARIEVDLTTTRKQKEAYKAATIDRLLQNPIGRAAYRRFLEEWAGEADQLFGTRTAPSTGRRKRV